MEALDRLEREWLKLLGSEGGSAPSLTVCEEDVFEAMLAANALTGGPLDAFKKKWVVMAKSVIGKCGENSRFSKLKSEITELCENMSLHVSEPQVVSRKRALTCESSSDEGDSETTSDEEEVEKDAMSDYSGSDIEGEQESDNDEPADPNDVGVTYMNVLTMASGNAEPPSPEEVTATLLIEKEEQKEKLWKRLFFKTSYNSQLLKKICNVSGWKCAATFFFSDQWFKPSGEDKQILDNFIHRNKEFFRENQKLFSTKRIPLWVAENGPWPSFDSMKSDIEDAISDMKANRAFYNATIKDFLELMGTLKKFLISYRSAHDDWERQSAIFEMTKFVGRIMVDSSNQQETYKFPEGLAEASQLFMQRTFDCVKVPDKVRGEMSRDDLVAAWNKARPVLGHFHNIWIMMCDYNPAFIGLIPTSAPDDDSPDSRTPRPAQALTSMSEKYPALVDFLETSGTMMKVYRDNNRDVAKGKAICDLQKELKRAQTHMSSWYEGGGGRPILGVRPAMQASLADLAAVSVPSTNASHMLIVEAPYSVRPPPVAPRHRVDGVFVQGAASDERRQRAVNGRLKDHPPRHVPMSMVALLCMCVILHTDVALLRQCGDWRSHVIFRLSWRDSRAVPASPRRPLHEFGVSVAVLLGAHDM